MDQENNTMPIYQVVLQIAAFPSNDKGATHSVPQNAHFLVNQQLCFVGVQMYDTNNELGRL